MEIVIKHPKIIDFYSKNKHLDVEYINLALIDFYDTFLVNQETITKNSALEILSSIQSLQHGLESQVLSKFYEIKHSYLEDLKTALEHQSNTQCLKIMERMEKENVHLLEKTQHMVQSMVPNTPLQAEHEQLVRQFREEMMQWTEILKSDVSMDKIHLVMSKEYQQVLAQIQQHEQRLQHKMGEIKELSASNQTYQEKISQDMSTFLSQYKISQKKGEFGEQLLYQCLCSLFPSAEIIQTTGLTSSGDFMMKRTGKPTILFENKNYESANVPKKEVDKFLFDVQQQQCSGIFMSQKSGIALKQNFEIELHQGHVLVYLHHMNYDQDKLLAACDIIDRLTEKFREHPQEDVTVSQELLQSIHQQYQTFLDKRERILSQMNDQHKKMVADIRELSIGELNSWLSTMFASTQRNSSISSISKTSSAPVTGECPLQNELIPAPILRCDICQVFTTDNPRSLNAHKPACKKKHPYTN